MKSKEWLRLYAAVVNYHRKIKHLRVIDGSDNSTSSIKNYGQFFSSPVIYFNI